MPATKGPTKTVQFRKFTGLNRTAARTALKDDQLYWNENVQSIGDGQLQTLPPRGVPVFTNPVGIVKIKGINIKIGGVEVARIIAVNADGSIDAINPFLLGSFVNIGGPGTVTDEARMVMWEDTPLLIGDPTTGYMSWDGTALTHYPSPTSVRDLAVFEGRVWLVSGLRSITFTAPASFTDFNPANGAGTVSIIDSVFIGAIEGLLSALELLWIMGPAAVNAISNVQAAGTPVITTFSNTNIVADVGTVKIDSIASFFRTFLFLTPYGVYAIVGATPQKLSDDLDGLFPLLSNDATELNPAGTFALNEVFIWAVMVHYNDPAQGLRPILLCFARNAWFVASQGNDLVYITGLVDPDTGQKQLWGTNTTSLFQCFAGEEEHLYQWQTKLWDFGSFTQLKQATSLAFEFSSPTGLPITPTVFLENENTSVLVEPLSATSNLFFWTTAGGDPFLWTQTDGFTPFLWFTTGGIQIVRTGQLNFSGHYLGIKVQGTSFPFTISAFALQYDLGGEWT